MKKNNRFLWEWKIPGLQKLLRVMKLTTFLLLISVINVFANKTYSQTTVLNLKMKNSIVKEVLQNIEEQSEFYFMYSEKLVDVNREVSVDIKNQKISVVLDELFAGTNVNYKVKDRFILLITPEVGGNDLILLQQETISGKVNNESGEPLPGVTILIKGTTQGTVTDIDGTYSLAAKPGDILVFSFVGMISQEVVITDQTSLDITMGADAIGLEEVVTIGYGTARRKDLTGSVSRVSEEVITQRQGVSLVQSLQGSTAGLNVGQVDQAGENPALSIRGRTSISGSQNPLIVVDGVIFRGDMIDINPNDIQSIDILKDASSTAIYGSQATNGVLLITTKTGIISEKPTITYSGRYTFQTPSVEFVPETAEEHIERITAGHFFDSRTPESGYLEPNPLWDVGSVMRDSEQLRAIENNLTFDWYDYVT
ncbi:MAG: carboxypeptidase-like regulatory domain-containing protein, partial [Bacteroidota bacterium]